MYKYCFDDNSSTRLVWCHLAKQLVFRSQFVYDAGSYSLVFEPYVHYIPVSGELSDLAEKLEFVQKHDLWARRVAERGWRLAREAHQIETQYWYVHTLLLELAKLQNGV